MSNSDLARRTEIDITFAGKKVTKDVSKYLLSLTYTDNAEDKTDDMQLSIDDREGKWVGSWLNQPAKKDKKAEKAYSDAYKKAYAAAYKKAYAKTKSKTKAKAEAEPAARKKAQSKLPKADAKGAEISAVIVQRNWESNGKDRLLPCGTFSVDSIDMSGPGGTLNIKAASISYKSTLRTTKKSKTWQNIKLSSIAKSIAKKNGLKCMYESTYDPVYKSKEQIRKSDIVFLRSLCKKAGISLKVTGKMLVLFDAGAYEKKKAVRKIKKGAGDVERFSFSTNLHDTAYSSCHVSYTNPKSHKTIEYTYRPRNADKTAQVLEVNQKVASKEDARKLAMKMLRAKNRTEYQASFDLVGDTRLVAGVTVQVSGWGMFDGKYIIETATHSVSGSGYTTSIKLRQVLKGY